MVLVFFLLSALVFQSFSALFICIFLLLFLYYFDFFFFLLSVPFYNFILSFCICECFIFTFCFTLVSTSSSILRFFKMVPSYFLLVLCVHCVLCCFHPHYLHCSSFATGFICIPLIYLFVFLTSAVLLFFFLGMFRSQVGHICCIPQRYWGLLLCLAL